MDENSAPERRQRKKGQGRVTFRTKRSDVVYLPDVQLIQMKIMRLTETSFLVGPHSFRGSSGFYHKGKKKTLKTVKEQHDVTNRLLLPHLCCYGQFYAVSCFQKRPPRNPPAALPRQTFSLESR